MVRDWYRMVLQIYNIVQLNDCYVRRLRNRDIVML